MSYVDLMSDVRWSETDHVNRVEAFVRSQVTHTREHVLTRRSIAFSLYLLAQMLPAGDTKNLVGSFGRQMSPVALQELMEAAAAFDQADTLAATARADSARLDAALDHEEARAALAQLPPVPDDGSEDPNAEERARLQAILESATADTLELVAQRDAFRAAQNPLPIEEPAP